MPSPSSPSSSTPGGVSHARFARQCRRGRGRRRGCGAHVNGRRGALRCATRPRRARERHERRPGPGANAGTRRDSEGAWRGVGVVGVRCGFRSIVLLLVRTWRRTDEGEGHLLHVRLGGEGRSCAEAFEGSKSRVAVTIFEFVGLDGSTRAGALQSAATQRPNSIHSTFTPPNESASYPLLPLQGRCGRVACRF